MYKKKLLSAFYGLNSWVKKSIAMKQNWVSQVIKSFTGKKSKFEIFGTKYYAWKFGIILEISVSNFLGSNCANTSRQTYVDFFCDQSVYWEYWNILV